MKNASADELRQEIKRLEFTVKRRGYTIGGMYWVIRTLIESNPYTYRMESVNVASGDQAVDNLKEQLASARKQIRDMMESRKQEGRPVADLEIPKSFDCNLCFNPFGMISEESDKKGESEPIDRRPVAFGCGHLVCSQCLIDWTKQNKKTSCPTCRQEIKSMLTLYI